MLVTELEFIENAYILAVSYDGYYKKWSYKYFDEAVIARSILEHHLIDGELETLREKML